MADTARQVHSKLERIKIRLEETAGHGAQRQKKPFTFMRQKTGHKVGIFSVEERKAGWLQAALHSPMFEGLIKKISYSSTKDKKYTKKISNSTFCIYLHDNRDGKRLMSPKEEEQVMRMFEGKPLIVVVVEDSGDGKRSRIQQGQPIIGRHARDLILFSQLEIQCDFRKLVNDQRGPYDDAPTYYNQHDPMVAYNQFSPATAYNRPTVSGEMRLPAASRTGQTAAKANQKRKENYRTVPGQGSTGPTTARGNLRIKEKHRTLRYYVKGKPSKASGPNRFDSQEANENKAIQFPARGVRVSMKMCQPRPVRKYKVGIFSRSDERDYFWMSTILASEYFRDHIHSVQSCYISNNGFQQFREAAEECTFAILYHTKNRGRINITDVTDSLYDYELEYLGNVLERDNVMVVIDDLEDVSNAEKRRILEGQPSISRWAGHLLLIAHADKLDTMHLVRKLKSVKQFCRPSENPSNEILSPTPPRRPTASSYRPQQESLTFSTSYSQPWPAQDYPDHDSHVAQTSSYRPQQESLTFSTSYSQPWPPRDYPDHDSRLLVVPRPDITILSIRKKAQNAERLRTVLSSEHRWVSFHQMSLSDDRWLGDIHCNVAIVYHSMRSSEPLDTHKGQFLYHNVITQLSKRIGRDNVMLVVDDLENSSDEEKKRILEKYQLRRCARDILPISHKLSEDEAWLLHGFYINKNINQLLQHSGDHQQQNSIRSRSQTCSETYNRARSGIGIFVGSGRDDYSWLVKLLMSEKFGNKKVTGHHLWCDQEQLETAARQCRFAILYHSEMNGGIPVNIHREYYYHEVLEQLSAKLGKQRVIVVIDEMSSSIDEVKSNILMAQPSFRKFSAEVFLFSKMEKIYVNGYKPENMPTLHHKLSRMREILK